MVSLRSNPRLYGAEPDFHKYIRGCCVKVWLEPSLDQGHMLASCSAMVETYAILGIHPDELIRDLLGISFVWAVEFERPGKIWQYAV